MSDAAEKPCPACDKGQKRACICRGKRGYKPRMTKAARAAFSRDTPPPPVGGGGGGASAAEGNMVFVSHGSKQPFALEKYTRPEPQRAPVPTTTATNSAPGGQSRSPTAGSGTVTVFRRASSRTHERPSQPTRRASRPPYSTRTRTEDHRLPRPALDPTTQNARGPGPRQWRASRVEVDDKIFPENSRPDLERSRGEVAQGPPGPTPVLDGRFLQTRPPML